MKLEIKQEDIASRALLLIEELSNKIVGQVELPRLVALSLLSSHHMFMIGEPGVGKTFLASKLKYVLKNSITFEKLMLKQTKVEELFGETKENKDGELVHDFEMTVLEANILILDEGFKADATILNGLLGVLSQYRNFYIRHLGEVKVPLISCFMASNELPTIEFLNAFDDRLHIRYLVERIKSDEDFEKMIKKEFDTSNDFESSFSVDEIFALKEEFSKVQFSEYVLKFYVYLKNKIIRSGIKVSDRKFDDAVKILKASAYLNNRTTIDVSDLFLLYHIAWKTLEDRELLHDTLNKTLFGYFDKEQKKVFFSTSSSVMIELNSILEIFSEIKSKYEVYIRPFLTGDIKFKNDEIEKYKAYEKDALDFYQYIQFQKERIVNIKNAMDYTYFVEELIEKNIFLDTITNSIYTDDVVSKIDELEAAIQELDREFNFLNSTRRKMV